MLGVSVYTWTATLGWVFVGIALGGLICGHLADRFPARAVWRACLIVGGAITPLCLLVFDLLVAREWISDLPVVVRAIAMAGVTLLLPSTALGAIVPAAIADLRGAPDRFGRGVGQIYAASTAGGITGTFLAGFLLIPTIGADRTIGLAGLGALLLGLLGNLRWGIVARLTAIATVGISGLAASRVSDARRCTYETAYFCVRVETNEEDAAAGPIRTLWLDHLSHSRVSLLDPRRLSFSYLRAYADVAALRARTVNAPDFLIIGAGAYGFPRYLETVYPSSTIDAIEIDPSLLEISHRDFGLSRDTRIRSYLGDARTALTSLGPEQTYDVIFADAFNDLAMPYHLTTVDYLIDLKARLAPGGLYVSNVIDHPVRHGRVIQSFYRTIRTAFRHAYVLQWGPRELDRVETLVIVGTDVPLDLGPLRRHDPIPENPGLSYSTAHVPELEAIVHGVLLTDDHAPIEQLVAPLYVLRN